MNKKLLSFLLAFVLIICAYPLSVFAASQPTDDEIAEAAAVIVRQNEGTYTSVNRDDNGALSVGWLQWHGNRALNLLRDIVNANPSNALAILGQALYNEICTAASWSTRVLTTEEAPLISKLLGTPEGIAAQDKLGKNDVGAYINHGKKLGISSPSALVFFADLENQCGYGGAGRVAGAAASLAESGFIMLNDLHQAAIEDSVAGKYAVRRNKVYNYALLLGWDDGSAAETPFEVWQTTASLNIRSGPGTAYDKLSSFANGTGVAILEKANDANGSAWGRTPVGWVSLSYCVLISTNPPTSDPLPVRFDAAGGELGTSPLISLPVSGVNRARGANELIVYNSGMGSSTLTNAYGCEATVSAEGQVVAGPTHGAANSIIPAGGFVISGHGSSATLMLSNIGNGFYVQFSESRMALDIYASRDSYIAGTKLYKTGRPLGELPTPVRYGYSFEGWYTPDGRRVTQESALLACEPLLLTARWEPVTVNLTIDPLEGNTVGIHTVTQATGINIYRNTDMLIVYDNNRGATTGTNKYGAEAAVDAGGTVIQLTGYGMGNMDIPDGGIVISGHGVSAQWVYDNLQVGRKVFFNPDTLEIAVFTEGGAYTKAVAFGTVLDFLGDAYLEGYTFAGWYTSQEGGVRVTPETVSAFTEDTTLYARYLRNTSTVSFDAAGGTGAPSEIVFDEGTSVILPDAVPSLTCKTFAGWALQPGGAAVYQPGDTYSGTDAVLYAVWQAGHPYVSGSCTATLTSAADGQCNYSYTCTLCGWTGAFTRPLAESSVNISLSAATATSGFYEITADVNTALKLKSLTFTVNYSDSFRLKSAEVLNPWTDISVCETEKGLVKVTVSSESGFVCGGTMLNIRLITRAAAEENQISLTGAAATAEDGVPAYADVKISAEPPADNTIPLNPGDVDGDGKLTIKDMFYLKLVLKGNEISKPVYADVDDNGKVNIMDVFYFKLYYKRLMV